MDLSVRNPDEDNIIEKREEGNKVRSRGRTYICSFLFLLPHPVINLDNRSKIGIEEVRLLPRADLVGPILDGLISPKGTDKGSVLCLALVVLMVVLHGKIVFDTVIRSPILAVIEPDGRIIGVFIPIEVDIPGILAIKIVKVDCSVPRERIASVSRPILYAPIKA